MRLLAALLALAVSATLLTSCVPDQRGEITLAQLESAGITIVDDESDVTSTPTSLTFTSLQAERMLEESKVGAGVHGADLDEIAPVDDGLPTASYLLAGWITVGESDSAAAARALYPAETNWTEAPSVVFPTVVVALFVADAMAAAAEPDSFTEDAPQGLQGPVHGLIVAPVAFEAGSGPCSTVTNFIGATIQGLFDVLRVIPGVIGAIDVLGAVGKFLSLVANAAIGLAQGVIEGVVSVILEPAMVVLRAAISALGVASLVMSYFTKERLVVTAHPGSRNTFAVDPSPGNPGSFSATTHSLSKGWPAALVDCAQVSGAKIPDLIRAGDIATWTPLTGKGLITLASPTSTVGGDKTTTINFLTGHEDAETAKGSENTSAARTSVSIPRKEVGDFLDLAATQLETVKADLLSRIPAPLRGAASAVFASILDPIVARIRAEIGGVAGGILTLKGQAFVWVTYHTAKEPEPGPAETEDPEVEEPRDSEYCTLLRIQGDIAEASLHAGTYPFDVAAAFAVAIRAIPVPPPTSLAADVETTIGFYDAVGKSDYSNPQPMLDYNEKTDVNARVRLFSTCEVTTFDSF